MPSGRLAHALKAPAVADALPFAGAFRFRAFLEFRRAEAAKGPFCPGGRGHALPPFRGLLDAARIPRLRAPRRLRLRPRRASPSAAVAAPAPPAPALPAPPAAPALSCLERTSPHSSCRPRCLPSSLTTAWRAGARSAHIPTRLAGAPAVHFAVPATRAHAGRVQSLHDLAAVVGDLSVAVDADAAARVQHARANLEGVEWRSVDGATGYSASLPVVGIDAACGELVVAAPSRQRRRPRRRSPPSRQWLRPAPLCCRL